VGRVQIPTLEEAVALCTELGLELWIDVKTWPKQTADAVVPLIQRYGAHHRVLVCSFNPAVLWHVRRRDPAIVTVQTRKRYLLSYLDGAPSPLARVLGVPLWLFRLLAPPLDRLWDWCLHRWLWRLNGITVMLVHHAGVSEDYVAQWARRGVAVVAWTVNARAAKAYYRDYLHIAYMSDDARPDADAPPQVFHMPAAF
jgi:glycerophosphoinositol glycerophosphodiesterase